MGILKSAVILAIVTALVFLGVLYLPVLEDLNPKPYTPNLPAALEGPLTPNGGLDKYERLFENELFWPESLAVSPEGDIYTGVSDGTIRRISQKSLSVVARTGKACAGQWEEPICGRPLGMRFDSKGLLHVVDAYHGYKQIDVKAGKVIDVLPATTPVEGHPLTLLNDLALGKDVVYLTQSSTRWLLTHVAVSLMEHENSGRLLQYDLKTKKVTVLAKDLYFPNGVQLSKDGTFLMVAETTMHRILKFDLRTKKMSVLLDKLPGEPDNIRPSSKAGEYWVALSAYRPQGSLSFRDLASPFPAVRTFILKTTHLVGKALTFLTKYHTCPKFAYVASEALNCRILADLEFTDKGMIVKFDESGKILTSYSAKDTRLAAISEVLEYGGHFFLGSWRNPFLAKITV